MQYGEVGRLQEAQKIAPMAGAGGSGRAGPSGGARPPSGPAQQMPDPMSMMAQRLGGTLNAGAPRVARDHGKRSRYLNWLQRLAATPGSTGVLSQAVVRLGNEARLTPMQTPRFTNMADLDGRI